MSEQNNKQVMAAPSKDLPSLQRLLRRPNPPPIPGLTLGDRRKLKQPCSLAGHRLIVSG
eukprot:CAMPEP_0119306558 /NCGR_PEP_ID=MMETSP1333-20130426/7284_1 /TAXON_ID=418940 /ORGANISM="Scyphosphaera apsteinii, Strain RCC1455" /LENGTH=58 /DNA_ID=CAMNT_0007309881 /DNA_START=31 /DNA_END=204 /DNA_ORIENTATION=+